MEKFKQQNLRRISIITYSLLLLYCLGSATSSVNLFFYDTVEVNDTFFTIGDIAFVNCSDTNIVKKIKECFAGITAPPSCLRPVSVGEIVSYFLKNKFPEINFTYNNKNFVYIKTSSVETTILFFRKEIFDYLNSVIKWKKEDWNVDIINKDEKVSYLKKPFLVEIEGLDDPYPRANKNLTIIIKQKGFTKRIGLKCNFTVNTDAAVAARDISRGSLITKEDFVMKKIDITHLVQLPILDENLLENRRVKYNIKRGSIIYKRMVENVPDIEKGEEISMILKSNNVLVSVPAISRGKGCIGDYIWVENTVTHKLIKAKIEKKGIVVVKKGGV